MYEAFFGLREKPFSIVPDPGFLYPSRKHSLALALLEYGLMNQAGFNVITGGVGTGKTTLIRHLLSRLDQDVSVGLISNTHPTFDLMEWIHYAFALDGAPGGKAATFHRFVDFLVDQYARQRRSVLIIDEAQNMSPATLEELRMLSNVNVDKDQMLQVILVGQAELRTTLRRPDMVQFAQRVAVDYHLRPLECEETHAYIGHRIALAGGDPTLFEDAACDVVHAQTGGVPRLINLLCDSALVYAFADQARCVTAGLVGDAARDRQEGGLFPTPANLGAPSASVTGAPAATSRAETVKRPAALDPPPPLPRRPPAASSPPAYAAHTRERVHALPTTAPQASLAAPLPRASSATQSREGRPPRAAPTADAERGPRRRAAPALALEAKRTGLVERLRGAVGTLMRKRDAGAG